MEYIVLKPFTIGDYKYYKSDALCAKVFENIVGKEKLKQLLKDKYIVVRD